MKKRIALFALLALALSACSGLDFNNNQNNNQNNGNNNPEQQSQDPNDVALTILNSATFFPEVGDAINFNDFVTFDAGFGHTISEYSFVSSDNSVISINGYSASCLKNGPATITVTGPGINRLTEISFWVGSFAGTYLPDSSKLAGLASITVGEVNENRVSNIHFSVKSGTFRKSQLNPYEGDGAALKNGTPLLQVDFGGNAPRDFSPINNYLTTLGVSSSYLTDIPANLYGYLTYDTVLSITTIFKGEVVEFIRVENQ